MGEHKHHRRKANVFDGSRRHDYKEFGDISETVQAQYGTGGNNTPIVVENLTFSDVAACRSADDGDKGVHSQMMVNPEENFVLMNKHDDTHATYQDVVGTVDCCIVKGTSNQLVANNMFVANTSIVRRLTPKECERLQAFPDDWTLLPDGWTDTKGKFHKPTDSNRYKALGNSIALCWWEWMAERMMDVFNEEIGEEATMASLFDGIGGFPLVYSRHGCRPVWASEIEEFPIAVTKARFPEE